MKHVAACGICGDVCGLNKKPGCICSSGVEEAAKQKITTGWGGKGVLCLVLDCALRRGDRSMENGYNDRIIDMTKKL